jgi:hypothetical protein
MFDGWVTVRKLATPESNGWEISAPQKSPINREILEVPVGNIWEIHGKYSVHQNQCRLFSKPFLFRGSLAQTLPTMTQSI